MPVSIPRSELERMALTVTLMGGSSEWLHFVVDEYCDAHGIYGTDGDPHPRQNIYGLVLREIEFLEQQK